MSNTTQATTVEQPVLQQPELLADDDRGTIEKIDPADHSHSVLRIVSKKGTVRANHYHQFDSHTCYLESGKIRYVERPLKKANGKYEYDESVPFEEYTIKPGQSFYTAPNIAHAMEFLEDSVFYAITPRSGDQETYEDDIVRVTLIDVEEAKARANG